MFDPLGNGTTRSGNGRGYTQPGMVGMGLDGQTAMSSFIPGGTFGGKSVGKGTVIPRHKPGRGGGSSGYNPHKPQNKYVTVDPHVPGRAVSLDLAKITAEASQQASDDGKEFADQIMDDPPEKMDGIEMTIEEGPRLAAYAAVRMLAAGGATPDDAFTGLGRGPITYQATPAGRSFDGGASPRPRTPPPMPDASTGRQKAASFGEPNVGRSNPRVNIVEGTQGGGIHVHQAGRPDEGPMARFRPEPAVQATPTPRAAGIVDRPQARDTDRAVAGPSRKILFDFGDQVGKFPVQYHDIIRTDGGIILAWDTRWPHGEPYSPEQVTNKFAVKIEGDDAIHLVEAVGTTFTFEHGGFRFYHLGILESMPAG
jgi:hypothetical protein